MSFRVKPSAFDAARAPLDRLQARGWIWRGRQALDRLACFKDGFQGQGWIGALTPWLDKAAELRETDRLILLRFEKPVEADCAALGRLIPLKQSDGVLASFPSALSGGEATRNALSGQLILIHQGERLNVPLSDFRPVDAAGWWSFDGLAAEESIALPMVAGGARERPSQSSTPFDPDAPEAGLESVRDRVRKARASPARQLWGLFAGLLGAIARLLIWLLIIGLVLNLAFALARGDSDAPLTNLLVCLFLIGLFFLFRPSPKLIGPPGGGAGQGRAAGSAASGGGQVHTPGMMRRALGWLVWNSALGTGVRHKYGQRLRELEKLFAQERFDEALRKAISLGAEAKTKPAKRGWFGDFPLIGPGLRKDLNIRDQTIETPAYGILTDIGFESIRELYRKQAAAFAERGDYDRAAFIYAELLNDPASAVTMFERKGDFATAARLAQGRRLPPTTFVPLWFRAGERQRALRLAAQFDAFAELSAHVKDGDPFHKELTQAWAKRLIDTGDHARALAMTERYADLAVQRRLWMKQAIEKDGDAIDAVLLARLLKCAPPGTAERAERRLAQLLAGQRDEDAAARIALAANLASRKFEEAAAEADFERQRLPLIALPLLRRLLADEAAAGARQDRRDAATALAEAAGQFALRVDLRRLHKVPSPPSAPVRTVTMAPAVGLPALRDLLCLPGDRLLAAHETGALVLSTFDGRRLWSDHVPGVIGLAAIGPGRIAVIRKEIEGTALSLVDLDARTHRDIGLFRIDSFSRHASEIGWLIFGGGRVAMLDTASLIAAAAEGGGPIEHHWTVPLTEPGRLLGFSDQPGAARFLFHRAEGGLLELWSLHKSNLQVTCCFLLPPERKTTPAQTYGWQGGSDFAARSGNGEHVEILTAAAQNYTLDDERRLIAERKSWLAPSQTAAASETGPRTLLWCIETSGGARGGSVPSTRRDEAEKGASWYGALSHAPKQMFSAHFPSAARLALRTSGTPRHAAIFDDLGRILVFDLERDAVLYRNDGR